MISNFATPYYLFDEQEVITRAGKIRDEIYAWSGRICYAIKANPFLIPALLPIVDKFEVCSPGELEICRRYRVPGEKILFSGVVKTEEDIQKALDYPVDTITLESMSHWTYLKEAISSSDAAGSGRGRMIKILPRLTSGAQFGMSFESILRIVQEQQAMDPVFFEGIHFFSGTQKKGAKYEKELTSLREKLSMLCEMLPNQDLILEYGPGLSVPYFVGDDFDSSLDAIASLKDYILSQNYPFRIDVELGRYIAASCGTYHTSVVDLKTAEDRYYCLVDGGINQVNYYGQNMAMRTPLITQVRSGRSALSSSKVGTCIEGKHDYMICGSLCTFADILVRGLELEDVRIGDELIFHNIGAYSVTESAYLFLSHPLPGIYLKHADGDIERLRDNLETFPLNSFDPS